MSETQKTPKPSEVSTKQSSAPESPLAIAHRELTEALRASGLTVRELGPRILTPGYHVTFPPRRKAPKKT